MAPLCASNQPHSVYPQINPLIHLCLRSPIYISTTVLHSSGPDVGPFVGLLVEVSINLSAIRQAEEEEGASLSSKWGIVIQQEDCSFWWWGKDVEVKDWFIWDGINRFTKCKNKLVHRQFHVSKDHSLSLTEWRMLMRAYHKPQEWRRLIYCCYFWGGVRWGEVGEWWSTVTLVMQ